MLSLTLITLLIGVLAVIGGWAATVARMDRAGIDRSGLDRTGPRDQREAVDASA